MYYKVSNEAMDNIFIIYGSTDRAITYYVENNEGHFNNRTTTGTSVKPSYVINIALPQWYQPSITLAAGKYRIAKCQDTALTINWEEVTYSTPTTISTRGTHCFIIVCKI